MVGISLPITLSHPLTLPHLFSPTIFTRKNATVTPISSMADYDRPPLSLLSSRAAYSLISAIQEKLK